MRRCTGPPDTKSCFPGWSPCLRLAACSAVQMPAMHDEPLRRLQNEVAAVGPWAPILADAGFARGLLPPGGYYDLLRPWCPVLDMWETIYLHVLTGGECGNRMGRRQ